VKRVVAVGGGTGMPILIKSLLTLMSSVDAVVTVADDGGSSGVLRQELDMLPPGDIRNCLVAMADDSIMSRLFQYRFNRGEGLKSHALGNLIISALTEITGGFAQAVGVAGDLVGARGRVLPAALLPLTLYAEVEPWPGTGAGKVVGQCNLANRLRPLKSISMEPADVQANPDAVAALEGADVIILGPGSLFTSVIANLLVKDVAAAIRRSKAKKIFLCNITTQPGETDSYTAADHTEAIIQAVGPGGCDMVITSNTLISGAWLAGLAESKSSPIVVEPEAMTALGLEHIAADVTDEDHPTHHDPVKLAALLQRVL